MSTNLSDNRKAVIEKRFDVFVFVALILILAKDYFWTMSGVRTELVGIFLLAVGAGYRAFTVSRFNLDIRLALLSGLILVAWAGSLLTTYVGVISTSSYFAAFVTAILISVIRPRNIPTSLTIIVFVNILIQLYESISGTLLFVYVVEDGDQYDEIGLSSSDGSLRTKGVFASPLNAVSVAMSNAFLSPKSPSKWLLLVACSLLAQGRLGIAVGAVGVVVSLLFSGRGANVRYLLLYVAGFIFTVIGWAAFFGTEQSIQRILEAGSIENSQNISRLYLWGRSLEELANYDLMSFLFGKFGYIKMLEGATESDWLRIILDNGIFCFAAFLIPLLVGTVSAVRRKNWILLFSIASCAMVMAVFPQAQSLPNGILTWVFLISLLKGSSEIITRSTSQPQKKLGDCALQRCNT